MASSPLPSAAVAAASSVISKPASGSSAQPCPSRVSFPSPLNAKGSRAGWTRASVAARAQVKEIVGVSNDVVSKADKDEEPEKELPSPGPEMSPDAITEFMSQVASLVKLVDSKDVVELQLKQPGCELIIRKKEALPQPPAPAPVVIHSQPQMMPPSYQSLPPMAAPAAPAASPAPAAAPAAAKQLPPPAKSSHPPLKSPMAGTFYRSPAPGQPAYVKPGDKVKKGQVLCIIEAMKLMNEIEADHAGTIVDIIAEDGKPVGVEQPLFVIEP